MQLISPRELYRFESYIDVTNIPCMEELVMPIQRVLRDEFGIQCELKTMSEVFDCEVRSHGEFVTCIDLNNGDMIHFCHEVVNVRQCGSQQDYDLKQRAVRFNERAYVYRWDNTREIDHVKFVF